MVSARRERERQEEGLLQLVEDAFVFEGTVGDDQTGMEQVSAPLLSKIEDLLTPQSPEPHGSVSWTDMELSSGDRPSRWAWSMTMAGSRSRAAARMSTPAAKDHAA